MNRDVRSTQPLSGMKLGLFGKGGSGKSTTTALLAHALRRRGYKTTVLDADSTNYGLNEALGIGEPPLPLMAYFGGAVFKGGHVSCPVDDPTPLAKSDLSWSDIPKEYKAEAPSGIRYLVAGKIGGEGPGAGCDGPVAKIARDVRLRAGQEQSVMIIDFKAGFEDSARGVVTGIDWGIIVVDPTTAAIQMAADLLDMLEQIRAGVPPATGHLETEEQAETVRSLFRNASIRGFSVVLNRVDSTETEEVLRGALKEHGMSPEAVLYTEPAISAAWLRGGPIGYTGESLREAATLVEKLESRLERKSSQLLHQRKETEI